jgi:hypothetical protein
MDLNILEKAARELKKGNQVVKSIVSPVEHKDLSSLSMQIAANLHANNGSATNVMRIQTSWPWI